MEKLKPYAVELREISKIYTNITLIPPGKKNVQALYESSFVLEKGKITSILGPNGAGKTTIMKIVAGLVLPDTGEVVFNSVGNSSKSRIGFVTPNERSFYWRLSGRENLRFFAALYGYSGKPGRSQIDRIIEETGLADYAEKPYRLYSSGIKQRLNIARALIAEPEIILLDEPTAHLDPLAKVELWKFLKSYFIEKKNCTICLATHDLEEAAALTDKMIILNEGRIVASGSIEELQRQMETAKKIVLEFDSDCLSGRLQEKLKGKVLKKHDNGIMSCILNNNMQAAEVLEIFSSEGVVPVSLNIEKPTLLSLILHYTGRSR